MKITDAEADQDELALDIAETSQKFTKIGEKSFLQHTNI